MGNVLILLTVQGLLGAFDNLWHHELKEKLPSRRSARNELLLHTCREFIYAIIFFMLGWYECLGMWAVFIVALLAIEIVITLLDFIEEDRTRKLPALERVLHTVLAINFGFFIALIEPEISRWFVSPTKLVAVDYGIWSWIMTVFSVGVFSWGVRDMVAVINLSKPPKWKKSPIIHGEKTNARNILVTGATGYIGESLCRTLIKNGDNVIVLTRQYEKADNLFGPHVEIVTDLEKLDSNLKLDAVISLAGASVIGGLWTKKRRQLLIDSRLNDLDSINALCLRLETKPKALINASAIGFYGVRQDEVITEKETGQPIFQSELCQKREEAADQFKKLNIRVCNLRIGVVFSNDGGAFVSMARPIKFGMGAVLGDGKQWMSWIYKSDLIRVILFLLSQEHLSGPVNATAPEPVTNEIFTKKVAEKFNRPVFFKIPAFFLKSMLGELSQLFLEGQRVVPEKLLEAGFRFNKNTLDEMLLTIDGYENTKGRECVKVYYNEQCPICDFEVSHYKRSASNDKCEIEFNDINTKKQALSMYKLEYEDIKRRMYTLDERGKLVSGIDAFLSIWRNLPGYRWLYKIVKQPVIYQLADVTYEFILVPCLACYNKRRDKKYAKEN
jgi:uncharacterized protein